MIILVLRNDESPRRSSGVDANEEAIENDDVDVVDEVKFSLTWREDGGEAQQPASAASTI